MKNIIHRLTISIGAVSLGAGLALAAHPNVAERQVNQQQRIHEGMRSGELTKRETARLERNASRVHRSIARDRRDGGASRPTNARKHKES